MFLAALKQKPAGQEELADRRRRAHEAAGRRGHGHRRAAGVGRAGHEDRGLRPREVRVAWRTGRQFLGGIWVILAGLVTRGDGRKVAPARQGGWLATEARRPIYFIYAGPSAAGKKIPIGNTGVAMKQSRRIQPGRAIVGCRAPVSRSSSCWWWCRSLASSWPCCCRRCRPPGRRSVARVHEQPEADGLGVPESRRGPGLSAWRRLRGRRRLQLWIPINNPCVGIQQDKGVGRTKSCPTWVRPPSGEYKEKDDQIQRGAMLVPIFLLPYPRANQDYQRHEVWSARAYARLRGQWGFSTTDQCNYCSWFFANEGQDGPITENRELLGSGYPYFSCDYVGQSSPRASASTVLLGEKFTEPLPKFICKRKDDDDGWDSLLGSPTLTAGAWSRPGPITAIAGEGGGAYRPGDKTKIRLYLLLLRLLAPRTQLRHVRWLPCDRSLLLRFAAGIRHTLCYRAIPID